MLHPVSVVADTEARLAPADRYVDRSCPAQSTTLCWFCSRAVKAGSVGFVEDAAEHVGLFFVAKKAQRFIFDRRACNRHFFKASL